MKAGLQWQFGTKILQFQNLLLAVGRIQVQECRIQTNFLPYAFSTVVASTEFSDSTFTKTGNAGKSANLWRND